MTTAAYRNRATGHYPITLDDLRRSAGMLFGEEPNEAVLDFVGVDPVEATEPPRVDPTTQIVSEGVPQAVGAGWRQTWTVSARPAPPVPQSVGPLQFRRAIRTLGLKGTFDAFVATLDEEGQETIEYATSIRRDDALIEMARVGLGWTDDQVDGLFRLAETL